MIRWIVRVSMAVVSLLVLARAAAAYEPPSPPSPPEAAYAPVGGYVAVGEYGSKGYAYGEASAAPVYQAGPAGPQGYVPAPGPCCGTGGYPPAPPPQAYYPPAPGPCCQPVGYASPACCEPGHWPPPIYHPAPGAPSCGACGAPPPQVYYPPTGGPAAGCGGCGGYPVPVPPQACGGGCGGYPPPPCAAPRDPRYPPPCQPWPGYGEVRLGDGFFWGAGGVGPEIIYGGGGGGGYAYAGAGASASSWASASASARVSLGGKGGWGGHRPPPRRPPSHGCGCH